MRRLAEELAARGIGVVYGGGAVGLMGVLADAVLAAGGEVIGVIPRDLERREVRTEHRATLLVDDEPGRLLDRLAAWEPATVEKWISRPAR